MHFVIIYFPTTKFFSLCPFIRLRYICLICKDLFPFNIKRQMLNNSHFSSLHLKACLCCLHLFFFSTHFKFLFYYCYTIQQNYKGSPCVLNLLSNSNFKGVLMLGVVKCYRVWVDVTLWLLTYSNFINVFLITKKVKFTKLKWVCPTSIVLSNFLSLGNLFEQCMF